MTTKLLAVSGLALLLGCTQAVEEPQDKKTGIDETFLDPTATPCNDFYQYACGTWMREHPLGSDSYRGRMQQTLARNSVLIGKIIDDDAAGSPYMNHRDADKVGRYYNACYQSRTGAPPLRGPLQPAGQLIASASAADDFAAAAAEAHAVGASSLFDLYAGVDPGNPSRRVLTFSEPGFSLPHRDYYLDPAMSVDAKYVSHIKALSVFGGSDLPVGDAAGVLAFERLLAAGTLTDAEWQDPVKTYHLMSWDAFIAACPHFSWTVYLDKSGIALPTEVNVLSPTYLATLDAALAGASTAQLRDELDWTLLEAHANTLGTPAVTEEAKFHWGVFYGDGTPYTPSWQCELETKRVLSYVIAQPFVSVVFGADFKARVEAMVIQIRAALGKMLSSRPWLDDPTKAEASTKLDAILAKVGYPAAWPSYDDLVVGTTSFLDNQVTLGRTARMWNLSSLDKPVDRTTWSMSPVTDNAMYSGQRNDITLPAAFVQPPHYEATFGDAYNYGAIGTTIGHELTHAFDATGRRFDAAGKLRDWWTQTVADDFSARAACLVDQYSAYDAAADVKVDGATTVDENIADLGGVRAAYAAYKALGETETFAGSFGADQQFFLSYAQMWCSNASAARAETLATLDTHAPERFRVNGVVSNMAEFGAAFGCAPNTAMQRSPRCEIW
jgi:putative endopeptidase